MKSLNWFARQRQMWIWEGVSIYGFIGRDHLMKKFAISRPQASVDLRQFQRDFPNKIRYDTSRKCYVLVETS